MSDWADDVVRKLQKKRDDERLETAKFVEQQRIKMAHAAPLWNSLKTTIRKRISELREKSGSDIIVIQLDQPNGMTLLNQVDGKGKSLHIEFSQATGKLSWLHDGQLQQQEWEISVTNSGGAEFQWGIGVPSSVDSIAVQMLNALLDI